MDTRSLVTESMRHRILLERAEALAGIGHYRDDLSTGELYWSPGLYDIAGVDAAEARDIAHLYAPLFTEPELERLLALREAAAKVRRSYSYETTFRRPDGAWRTIVNLAVPEFDSEGEVRAFIGVVRDLTQERAREKALSDLAAQYERAERLAGMYHSYENFVSETLTVSPTFFEITGAPPVEGPIDFETLKQRFYGDKQYAESEARRERVKRFGEPASFELPIERETDGARRILHIDTEPDFGPEGRIVGQFGIVRDVTELKQAATELERSNRLLERAQRLGRIGHCYDDYSSETLQASDMFYEIFGLERPTGPFSYADWLRTVWSDEAVEPNLRGRDEAARSGRGVLVETGFIHPIDGRRRYIRLLTDPDFDENGEVVGSFAIVEDITDLRRASFDLERTNRLFDRAQKLAHVGHAYYDLARDRIDGSPTFFDIIGVEPWDQSPPLREFVRLIFSEDAADPAADEIMKAAASDAPISHDMVIRRADDGEKRNLVLVLEQHRDRKGETVGLFWIIQDVTHLRQTERDLRDREVFLRKGQQAAHIAPFRYDLVKRAITGASASREFYGWPADWPDVISPDDIAERLADPADVERVTKIVERAREDGTSFVVEYAVRRLTQGDVRHIRIYGDPELDPSGAVIAFRGVTQDVTDEVEARKERQTLREQIERAQRVETLGFFVGGLAHEVRNIVQPLPFLSRELAAAMESGRLEEAAGTLDALKIAGERALSAVRDMLEYISAERESGVARPFGELLSVTERFVRAALRADFSFEADEETRATWVDLGRTGFLQIVLNLAQNAVAAGGEGVSIRLSASRRAADGGAVESCDTAGCCFLVVTISDDGPGMDAEALAHMFTPFGGARGLGGTGLGLPLVRNIVERWGGSISATSTPGAGTTFEVQLPCADAPDAAAT